ncbi:hypothetical protein DFP72DRAFT_844809 [Ephemerocybe angulata]|uniref:Uncharacterized protein n=1 Tax=Ephemerocybe angulata TaxID=980116 RepID=A0A8H6M7T5_9AGAR|nr:hypothetical protein DFP72DRAFT_844809 [Tulosesus angulatus]
MWRDISLSIQQTGLPDPQTVTVVKGPPGWRLSNLALLRQPSHGAQHLHTSAGTNAILSRSNAISRSGALASSGPLRPDLAAHIGIAPTPFAFPATWSRALDISQGRVPTNASRSQELTLIFLAPYPDIASMARTTIEWIVIAIASLRSNGHGPTLKVRKIKDAVFEEAKLSSRRFAPRRPINELITEGLIHLSFADLVVIPGFRQLDQLDAEVNLTKEIWNELPGTNASTHDQLLIAQNRKPSRSAGSGRARQAAKRFQVHEAQIKRFNELVVFVDLDVEYAASELSADKKARMAAETHAKMVERIEEFKQAAQTQQLDEAAQSKTISGLVFGFTEHLSYYAPGVRRLLGLSDRLDTSITQDMETFLAKVDQCMETLIANENMKKGYIKTVKAMLCEAFGPGSHFLLMQIQGEAYAGMVATKYAARTQMEAVNILGGANLVWKQAHQGVWRSRDRRKPDGPQKKFVVSLKHTSALVEALKPERVFLSNNFNRPSMRAIVSDLVKGITNLGESQTTSRLREVILCDLAVSGALLARGIVGTLMECARTQPGFASLDRPVKAVQVHSLSQDVPESLKEYVDRPALMAGVYMRLAFKAREPDVGGIFSIG